MLHNKCKLQTFVLCQSPHGLQVREGLLFVWPLPGPEAFIHSAAVQPAGSQVFAQVAPGIAPSQAFLHDAEHTRDDLEVLVDTIRCCKYLSHATNLFLLLCAEDVTAEHTMYFQRDFPVPYDIVVENIGDQSHVPFAHHGVAGNR